MRIWSYFSFFCLKAGDQEASQLAVFGEASVKATRPRVLPKACEWGWAQEGRKVVLVIVVWWVLCGQVGDFMGRTKKTSPCVVLDGLVDEYANREERPSRQYRGGWEHAFAKRPSRQ